MILNHKQAIEFLVDSAAEVRFDRRTIMRLHLLLADELLPNPDAVGRLRRIKIEIKGAAFKPLQEPEIIEECFDQVLATAEAIQDPFEQALFIMVHLPHLQAFEDANKRTSRLAANIPFIRTNRPPISFTGVPTQDYMEAMLGVYELNRVDLLKDLFIWAYECSAERYETISRGCSEPDSFSFRYQLEVREIVRIVVLECLGKRAAFERIAAWAEENIEKKNREQFRHLAEGKVHGLREVHCVLYKMSTEQFHAWQAVWNRPEERKEDDGSAGVR